MSELINLIFEYQKKEQSSHCQEDSVEILRKAMWDSVHDQINIKNIPINELLIMAFLLKNNSKQLSSWKELKRKIPYNLFENPKNIHILYLELAFNSILEEKIKAFGIFIEKFINSIPSSNQEKISLPIDTKGEFYRLNALGLLGDQNSDSINVNKIARIILESKDSFLEKTIVLLEVFGSRKSGEAIQKKIFEIILLSGAELTKKFNQKNISYLTIINNWIGIYIKHTEAPKLVQDILERSDLLLKKLSNHVYENLYKYKELSHVNLDNIKQFKKKKQIVVGFVCYASNNLAHIKNLTSFLKGLINTNPVIQPILIIWGEKIDFNFERNLNEMHIPFILINNDLNLYVNTINAAIVNDLDLLVFISTIDHIYFFSLFNKKLFKVVWWSMKYSFPILKDKIWHLKSGQIGLQKYTKIDNFLWRNASTSLMEIFERSSPSEVHELKIKIKSSENILLLGAIGRAAKLRDPEYISAIKNILNLSAKTVFVYTCEEAFQAEINNLINKYGDSAKMISLGWLQNTKLAANIIDIYLDFFPFGSGHTAFEAIALSKPVISVITKENIHSSYGTPFLRYIEENSLEREKYGFVSNLNEYVSLACKLVENIDLRNQIGLALKDLLIKINPSIEESSKQIEKQFLEIYYEEQPI